LWQSYRESTTTSIRRQAHSPLLDVDVIREEFDDNAHTSFSSFINIEEDTEHYQLTSSSEYSSTQPANYAIIIGSSGELIAP